MSSSALPTKVTYNEQTNELDRSIGVLFIGYSISMVLYGLTSYQSYIYYSTLQGETRLRKYAIGLLTLLDAGCVATLTQALHFYAVTEFPRTVPAVVSSTRTFTADNFLAIVMIFIVQMLYAHKVQKHNNFVAIIVAFLSVAGFGLGIAMIAFMINNSDFNSFHLLEREVIIAVAQTATLLASLVTFVTLWSYDPWKASPTDTRSLWYDGILDILIDKNGAAALVQLAYLISFVAAPTGRFWMIFQTNSRRVFFLSIISNYINRAVATGKSTVNGLTSTHGTGSTGSTAINSRSKPYVSTRNNHTYEKQGPVDDGMSFRVEVVKTVEAHDDFRAAKQ